MALTREAADACATAREAATELHRLVPTVHGATAVGVREPFRRVRLAARHIRESCWSWAGAARAAGYSCSGDTIVVTSQGIRFLRAGAERQSEIATGFWGDPAETLGKVQAAVAGAGASGDPVFAAAAGLARHRNSAARLFDRLYHRADAHAAACGTWRRKTARSSSRH